MVNAALSRLNTGLAARLNAPGVTNGDARDARRIPLALIDEDPDQPRRTFHEADLRMLADSIALAGLLQAITVRPAPAGRYFLRYGARRLRACKLLGWADIPVIVRDDARDDADAQAIENQHRAGLADSEIAAHVESMTARKMTNAQIATVLALRGGDQSIKQYRALADVRQIRPLAAWIDKTDGPRPLYDALLAWRAADDAQREAMAALLGAADALTVAEVRRIVAATKAREGDVPEAEVMATAAGSDTPPVQAVHTIAPEPEAAAPRPARHRSAPAHDDDPAEAARVVKVRAWLDSPQRPRPPLTV